MMTSPISTASPISELAAARRYLLKCQERLLEVRMLRGRVADYVDRGFAIEDATAALYAALSWAWDAQQRADAHEWDRYGELIDIRLNDSIRAAIAETARRFRLPIEIVRAGHVAPSTR